MDRTSKNIRHIFCTKFRRDLYDLILIDDKVLTPYLTKTLVKLENGMHFYIFFILLTFCNASIAFIDC